MNNEKMSLKEAIKNLQILEESLKTLVDNSPLFGLALSSELKALQVAIDALQERAEPSDWMT